MSMAEVLPRPESEEVVLFLGEHEALAEESDPSREPEMLRWNPPEVVLQFRPQAARMYLEMSPETPEVRENDLWHLELSSMQLQKFLTESESLLERFLKDLQVSRKVYDAFESKEELALEFFEDIFLCESECVFWLAKNALSWPCVSRKDPETSLSKQEEFVKNAEAEEDGFLSKTEVESSWIQLEVNG